MNKKTKKALASFLFLFLALAIFFVSGGRIDPFSLALKLESFYSSEAYSSSTSFFVSEVIDGDTIKVMIDGQEEKVRFLGLDAPEIKSNEGKSECYALEAKKEVERLVNLKWVFLEKDPSQGERDKYGRLLAYVFLSNGDMLNEHLLRLGYAKDYKAKNDYRYQDLLERALNDAKQSGYGLWDKRSCPDNN